MKQLTPKPLLSSSLLILLAGGACHFAPRSSEDFAGPPGSQTPSLTSTPDGGALLTWLESAGEGHALRIAARTGQRWGEPVTVAEGRPFFVNWADFPAATVTSDGRWVVHWLERTAPTSYAYHTMVSVSPDRGATWSKPIRLHQDSSNTEHGFAAHLAGPGGTVHAAWLDGRATGAPTHGPMSVRFATLTRDGQPIRETLLDDRTCDCCQVAIANPTSGILVAYRDRTDDEIRDIYTTRLVGDEWTEPAPVARDGWEHRACPVNGPTLAVRGDYVTITWYTEAGGVPRVWAAQSPDGGATWGSPIPIDQGDPLGRAEAATLDDGSTAVIWLEGKGENADWVIRRIGPDGSTGAVRTVARTARSRAAGFPRMVLDGKDLLVAWTRTGDDPQVVVTRLEPSSLPPSTP